MLSRATVTAVGLTCKAFLNLGFCSVTVNGLPTLLNALEGDQRNMGQGIVTGMSSKFQGTSLDMSVCSFKSHFDVCFNFNSLTVVPCHTTHFQHQPRRSDNLGYSSSQLLPELTHD
jgi:hypothetical protein